MHEKFFDTMFLYLIELCLLKWSKNWLRCLKHCALLKYFKCTRSQFVRLYIFSIISISNHVCTLVIFPKSSITRHTHRYILHLLLYAAFAQNSHTAQNNHASNIKYFNILFHSLAQSLTLSFNLSLFGLFSHSFVLYNCTT